MKVQRASKEDEKDPIPAQLRTAASALTLSTDEGASERKHAANGTNNYFGDRPECFKNTFQEVSFVFQATMATATSSFLTGVCLIVTASIGRDLGMTQGQISWITASTRYVLCLLNRRLHCSCLGQSCGRSFPTGPGPVGRPGRPKTHVHSWDGFLQCSRPSDRVCPERVLDADLVWFTRDPFGHGCASRHGYSGSSIQNSFKEEDLGLCCFQCRKSPWVCVRQYRLRRSLISIQLASSCKYSGTCSVGCKFLILCSTSSWLLSGLPLLSSQCGRSPTWKASSLEAR